MGATMLFVHGTGVRADGYSATLRVIKQQAAQRVPDLRVVGCYWGDAVGASLYAGGASIPGYDEAGGNEPSDEDQLLALWTVLYTDPWYELRLLRQRPTSGPVPFGQEPPPVLLRRSIDTFQPSAAVAAAFVDAGLSGYLEPAFGALRRAPELNAAVATAPADPLDHRRAIARAVVAWALVASGDAGAPALDGAARDQLVLVLTSALKGDGLGVAEFLLRPVKGLALRMMTSKLTGDRGSISDAAAPLAGDVLRFLAHGEPARDFVRAAIEDGAGDPADGAGPVYLLAHSLGGIICADLLVRAPVLGVAGLITVGSQTPFLYEIGAFPALSFPDYVPDHFPRWLNIYDRRDILSYLAHPVFGDRARDVLVDNRQPFPQSHSAYWGNPAVWGAIDEFVT